MPESAPSEAPPALAASGLNPEQERIVDHLEGPALVIAGAGSGKTRVMTHRVARLIAKGVPPGAILMMTFTNKAAEEMRTRVEALLQGKGATEGLVAGTFHSVANRFLRRYANLVGYRNNFTILDDADSKDLVRAAVAEVMGKQSQEKRFPTAAVVQNVLSMAFNRSLELGELLAREYPWLLDWGHELVKIGEVYAQKKRLNNCMDFDDLLANWHRLLSENTRLEMATRLRYLMVDEYQDTNLVQAQILELLAAPHGNLMVVGDDAQSIYGWRGANFENILGFPKRFGGVTYRLEQNYRSTPNILDLANESINHNSAQFEKHLAAVKPRGERPTGIHFYDQYQEAEYVCEQILAAADKEVSLREIGVLYRNHMQSAILQMRLTERGIPFTVRSGIKFFEQAHIKDVVAFMKVLFNPLDEIAWMRILKMLPGVGNVSAYKIYRVFLEQQAVRLSRENLELSKLIPAKAKQAWQDLADSFKLMLADGMTPSDMITSLLTGGFYYDVLYTTFPNAEERAADLRYLAEFASKYRSLERFLSQLALVGSTVIRDYDEEQTEDPEYVTLSSIHQAKGLEWDIVFVLGLSEGQFPHARCLEPPERLEEERRLFYVAVTRCRRQLHLTVPLMTTTAGRNEICRPSRFVEELTKEIIDVQKLGGAESLKPYLGMGNRMSVEW